MHYVLYSYSKVSYRKENVKIVRKRKCIYGTLLYLLKKNACMSGLMPFKPKLFEGQLYSYVPGRKQSRVW